MPAPNGATYHVHQHDMTRSISAFGQAWAWAVEITHPEHPTRIVLTDYNGRPFDDDLEMAEGWAEYDGEHEYQPGEPIYRRKRIDTAA